ncbi:MAG TPA: lipocalin family protein [Flavitalea sp.]|nr:lipocalin family protein [Flavitalea sp.]
MKTNPFANSILAATILLLLTVSCKKDPAQSRKEMLTTGKWRTIAQTVSPAVDWDGDGDLDTDLQIITDACIKDDYAIFRTDGSVEENEGPSKCDAADPQSEILTWSLKNNDMTLVVDGEDFTIEQMSETTMKLKISEFGVMVSATLQKF